MLKQTSKNVEKTKKVNENEIDEQIKMMNITLERELYGLSVFVILFIVAIPLIMLSSKMSLLVLYYFANLDLIANILNHYNLFFDNLYYPTPLSEYSFWSTSFINYLSLIGIASLISIFTLKEKSVFIGLAMGTTLFAKHIISTPYIYRFIRFVEKEFEQYQNTLKYTKLEKSIGKISANTVSIIVGLLMSFVLVLAEYAFSLRYSSDISQFLSFFYEKIINLF